MELTASPSIREWASFIDVRVGFNLMRFNRPEDDVRHWSKFPSFSPLLVIALKISSRFPLTWYLISRRLSSSSAPEPGGGRRR